MTIGTASTGTASTGRSGWDDLGGDRGSFGEVDGPGAPPPERSGLQEVG
jgi:hypothetical protein